MNVPLLQNHKRLQAMHYLYPTIINTHRHTFIFSKLNTGNMILHLHIVLCHKWKKKSSCISIWKRNVLHWILNYTEVNLFCKSIISVSNFNAQICYWNLDFSSVAIFSVGGGGIGANVLDSHRGSSGSRGTTLFIPIWSNNLFLTISTISWGIWGYPFPSFTG